MFAPRYFPGRYYARRYFPGVARTWISGPELASMRAAMVLTMVSSATLVRATRADDGQGGSTLTWSDVAAYAARLALAGTGGRGPRREMAEADRPVAETVWTLLLPHGTDVRPTDRVRISGVEYEVVEGDSPRSEALCLELAIRRLN